MPALALGNTVAAPARRVRSQGPDPLPAQGAAKVQREADHQLRGAGPHGALCQRECPPACLHSWGRMRAWWLEWLA